MSRRRLALAAGATLLVAALTGCGKVTVESLVYDDATYDMTLYLLREDAQVEAGGATTEGFAENLTAGLDSTPGFEDWTFTPYVADGHSGVKAVGTGIDGEDEAVSGSGMFESDGETITFAFQYPFGTAVEGTGIPTEQADGVTLTMTVEFPGEVIDHNGMLLDDQTVTWTATTSQDPDFSATAATSIAKGDQASQEAAEPAVDEREGTSADSHNGTRWPWLLPIGLGVLAAAGLTALLLLRGRDPKRRAPGSPQQKGHQTP